MLADRVTSLEEVIPVTREVSDAGMTDCRDSFPFRILGAHPFGMEKES